MLRILKGTFKEAASNSFDADWGDGAGSGVVWSYYGYVWIDGSGEGQSFNLRSLMFREPNNNFKE